MDLEELCDWVQYKAGWMFSVMNHEDGHRTLCICINTVDAYNIEMIRPVMHYTPIPDPEPANLYRWLLDQIVKIETHEACEFFQVKGFRPFAPSHEPGDAPYIITQIADSAGKLVPDSVSHAQADQEVGQLNCG